MLVNFILTELGERVHNLKLDGLEVDSLIVFTRATTLTGLWVPSAWSASTGKCYSVRLYAREGLTLVPQSASSIAVTRITHIDMGDIHVPKGHACDLHYDWYEARWFMSGAPYHMIVPWLAP